MATLAWVFAITGFALYLASFKTFEDTYGTIGSGLVLLVWLTMFTMLYYVTPDFRVSGIAALGAGAALSTVTWLAANAVLAVCVANLASLRRRPRHDRDRRRLPRWRCGSRTSWCCSASASTRSGPLARRDSGGRPCGGARTRPRRRRAHVKRNSSGVVGHALQNDVAHDGMLSPIADAEEETARMSDLELDLADWGFTYGVAWAAARAQDPQERRRLGRRARAAPRPARCSACTAGRRAGRIDIRREIRRRRPQEELVVERIEGAAGNGHGKYGLLR